MCISLLILLIRRFVELFRPLFELRGSPLRVLRFSKAASLSSKEFQPLTLNLHVVSQASRAEITVPVLIKDPWSLKLLKEVRHERVLLLGVLGPLSLNFIQWEVNGEFHVTNSVQIRLRIIDENILFINLTRNRGSTLSVLTWHLTIVSCPLRDGLWRLWIWHMLIDCRFVLWNLLLSEYEASLLVIFIDVVFVRVALIGLRHQVVEEVVIAAKLVLQ